MNIPGYESLARVLHRAYDQAAQGKGAERHACSRPFTGQPMQSISELLGSETGLLYQAMKKIQESQRLDQDAAIRELLGAINYIAGAVIFKEGKQGPANGHQHSPECLVEAAACQGWLDTPEAIDALLKVMVNRFLTWKLPEDFAPDGGISFGPLPYQTHSNPHWPTGTNLLTADQAREMFERCFPRDLIAPVKDTSAQGELPLAPSDDPGYWVCFHGMAPAAGTPQREVPIGEACPICFAIK